MVGALVLVLACVTSTVPLARRGGAGCCPLGGAFALVLCRGDRRRVATKLATIGGARPHARDPRVSRTGSVPSPPTSTLCSCSTPSRSASLIGLGVGALEHDLRDAGFGWRQVAAALRFATRRWRVLPFLQSLGSGRFGSAHYERRRVAERPRTQYDRRIPRAVAWRPVRCCRSPDGRWRRDSRRQPRWTGCPAGRRCSARPTPGQRRDHQSGRERHDRSHGAIRLAACPGGDLDDRRHELVGARAVGGESSPMRARRASRDRAVKTRVTSRSTCKHPRSRSFRTPTSTASTRKRARDDERSRPSSRSTRPPAPSRRDRPWSPDSPRRAPSRSSIDGRSASRTTFGTWTPVLLRPPTPATPTATIVMRRFPLKWGASRSSHSSCGSSCGSASGGSNASVALYRASSSSGAPTTTECGAMSSLRRAAPRIPGRGARRDRTRGDVSPREESFAVAERTIGIGRR